jgi:hypothetical protein
MIFRNPESERLVFSKAAIQMTRKIRNEGQKTARSGRGQLLFFAT